MTAGENHPQGTSEGPGASDGASSPADTNIYKDGGVCETPPGSV